MATRNARMSISMYDARGNSGTALTHLTVDDTQTLSAAYAALATFSTSVATVSDGGVHDATFSLINRAVASAPGSDADIAAGAVFGFGNATDSNTYGLYIPSFDDSLLGTGGHIDIGTGVPAAFVADMLAAVLGGHFTDTRFFTNSVGIDAFLSNRKRRRRVR